MQFTNHRVKYIEDIVDLWTFLGDADSEIMGSPDSASHTECNSMCLCTWIWWVTLRWSTFSFSSLFFYSFCIYAHHIPSLFSFFFLHFMPYFPPFWLHPIVHFSRFPVAFSIITSLSPFMSLSHLPPFSCPPLFPSPSHVQFVDRPSEKTETKVDTIVSSPPSLLHLLFCHLLISFFFRSLVSLKWSFLSCSGCCLLCCYKTTQEPKQQLAPKHLQPKQMPPQNQTTQQNL